MLILTNLAACKVIEVLLALLQRYHRAAPITLRQKKMEKKSEPIPIPTNPPAHRQWLLDKRWLYARLDESGQSSPDGDWLGKGGWRKRMIDAGQLNQVVERLGVFALRRIILYCSQARGTARAGSWMQELFNHGKGIHMGLVEYSSKNMSGTK